MIAVVNDKYQYIFLYSAKAGCTSLRKLYLDIHKTELSQKQKDALDWYHNLNEVQAYQPEKDYSGYFTFLITRDPYSRIISAFLDQYVYARSDSVKLMVSDYVAGAEPKNFLEFLQLLNTVPDSKRDSHFQTQAYFEHSTMVVTTASPRFRWLKQKPPHAFGVDYMGRISNFKKEARKIYKRIFKRHKGMCAQALGKIRAIEKTNSSFYGRQNYADAALMDVGELNELVFAPKPQDFLKSKQVIDLIEEIYRADFRLFEYKYGDLPFKLASPEIDLVPADMDWKTYIRLNPDLPPDQVYNERGVVRHYLEFGRHEKHPRAYKIEAPEGFDWQRYLTLHEDLVRAGITTEEAAIEHYISFGIRELRAIH